jgi:UDP-N-acetyl-2-amino-2-deoxyglucuronate dehydrogenase
MVQSEGQTSSQSPPARPLRFGIVGCGGIAGLHAECLKALEKEGLAVLAAGADPLAESRTKFTAKWGVPTFATLEEMLRSDVEVCTITSPSGLHGDQVIQCAKAGKHVLCEKPLDLKLCKADAAIRACKEAGVTLGGIFQQRFSPTVKKVKRAIDEGFFGDIVLAHCETPWYRSQAYYDSGKWRGTWALDCGVLSNQAPHMIDRMLWLAGDAEAILSATCDCGKDRAIEAETVAVATARLTSGALATIIGTTLAFDGMPQRLLICGTEGSCQFTGDDLTFFKTSKPFHDAHCQPPDVAAAAPKGENRASDPLAMSNAGHLANIRDFAQAVRQKRAPLITGEEYRKVTRVLNLIYETAGVGPFAK